MAAKKPNLIDTDFKAAAFAASLIDRGAADTEQIMILPKGPMKRAYAKEIAEVSAYQSEYRNRTMTLIEVNREGLYDMLPEGLFHKPPASSVMITEEEMVKDIKERREQEKNARLFFAPFEAELNRLRTLIELYEIRLDKKTEYNELVNIFLTEWKEFKCFTNRQMIILMHVLPVIHEQRNNLPFISDVLSIMFDVDFRLEYHMTINSTLAAQSALLETRIGSGTLGVNFIAGSVYEPEEELLITIGPVTSGQMLTFLPGTAAAEALEVLLNYLVPLGTATTTKFEVDPDYQKFVLGLGEDNACMGFTTYLGN
ncbi:type VI secretion system baseplate subunit TssG [Mucilaginibacter sp. KACC 22063]|uniref:type VI secretion system baseplate subunit TssG n=1 Tax=Mucilaginibacter sp. KACC 22063 TaxID=3025666 RepID=UPI00236583C0|nr:type VI secretion system baseplate subunit TssG [Mucilaginibacter sp. KACC 22063]WDF54404.1 type VI secretion system baseplate subunit TssG [Mucilaginibacter sp. KACC 22063]